MIARALPIVLVIGVGCNEFFHALFDLYGYEYKVMLVGWVISMDKTASADAWRGIDSPIAAYVAYAGIWCTHAIGGAVTLSGAYRLIRTDPQNNAGMKKAYALAEAGIGISAALYLVGFIAIASGWFLMHAAPTPPNFLANAQLLFISYMTVLIYLQTQKGSEHL
jgi:predicted small integral membrane protein